MADNLKAMDESHGLESATDNNSLFFSEVNWETDDDYQSQ